MVKEDHFIVIKLNVGVCVCVCVCLFAVISRH
jgi:hypothetical protein